MNVVYCVTANYIEKIKPSIRSLRHFNPKVKITVVTETDKIDIEDVKVVDISGQKWFTERGVNYHNPYTYIGLLKVCYQSILTEDKVIHLDADTIVCGSLKDMVKIDLRGKWYAMTPEYMGGYKPFGDLYYNAGVMVINLKQLRKDGVQDQMVEYLNTVRQPWCEQDAFNKFGIEQNKIKVMDVRYNENMMTGKTNDPAIVHYCAIPDWWTNEHMYRREYLEEWK